MFRFGLRSVIAPTVGSSLSHTTSPLAHPSVQNALPSPFSSTVGAVRWARHAFWRRKGFWEWRRKLIHKQNQRRRSNRHIWPRYEDPSEAPPSKGGGQIWLFKKAGLKHSKKRIVDWCRLIRGLHLQDAIDWIASIPVNRLQPVFEVLKYAQKQCINDFGADPGRLYIHACEVNYGTPVKYIRFHAMGKFGLIRSWRNVLRFWVREIPMDEYFHRLHILKTVPKSMGMDMRLALNEKRVGPGAIREWWPYLNAHTRYRHWKDMKVADAYGRFDYYQERRNFTNKYMTNKTRRTNELREQRGLTAVTAG